MQNSHLENLILGNEKVGAEIRRKLENCLKHSNLSLLSKIYPKNFVEVRRGESWINALEEELNQIEKNQTWEFFPRPKDKNVIGTKWIFRNKLNENGQVVRNKSRLVCKGYAQVEGIYFEDNLSPVSRIKSIIMLLEFVCHENLKIYQMDVKSTFLNGNLEEVYIKQLKGFQLS